MLLCFSPTAIVLFDRVSLWWRSLSIANPNQNPQLHNNMRDGRTHNTWQYFHFFDSGALCVRTERIPFTVFTKTCFSLVGSFSSSSTPWKMRPNVPVKRKKDGIFIYLRKRAGETKPETAHAKTRMSPHSQAAMPGWSADRDGQVSA